MLQSEMKSLFRGPYPHQRLYFVEQLVQINFGLLQGHPTGLNLGHVQDIVDQVQQVLAAADNDIQRLLLCGRHIRILLEQSRKTEHGIEGSAQLMAHVRQERALLAIGGFGPGLGFSQLFRPVLHHIFEVLSVLAQFVFYPLAFSNVACQSRA